MVKVSKANVYLKVGLGLDQWADGIIAGSRNAGIRIVDCSKDIAVLEKPTDKVTAAMGDVHPNGNPHYWLDPKNGAQAARTIAEALGQADPTHATDFRARAETFAKECDAAWDRGRQVAGGLPVKEIVTYHRSWSYLAAAFGLTVAGTVEPVPGIPPTARHLADLLESVRARHLRVLLQEPYFSGEAGKFLAREGGLRVVVSSASCETPESGSYLAHFADVLRQIGEAEVGTP
jgi:zinc/manganese transport system substrate-binding protein